MADIKLTYFDFDGGRGEVARLAMHLAGIAFRDDRVGFKEWQQRREQMPFRALPVLAVDGKVLTQSNAINRYVGRLANLYPQDPWQAALCDEAMDAVEDLDQQIGPTLGLEGDAKKKAREALASGPIPRYLEQLAQRLQAAGGEWFAGGAMSVADLKVWMLVRWLRGGVLDHIPKDIVDRCAPLLVRHADRLAAHPALAAYYAARKK